MTTSPASSAVRTRLHHPGLPCSTVEPVSASGRPPARGATVKVDHARPPMRLSRSAFLSAQFSKPFAVVSPRFSAEAPPGEFGNPAIVHLIVSGSCTIEVETGERHGACAGDLLLLPSAAPHRLWSGDCGDVATMSDLMHSETTSGVCRVDYGGGGETTEIISGFVNLRAFLRTPVFGSLPRLLINRISDDRICALVASMVRDMTLLAHADTPGAWLTLDRLMELLFADAAGRQTTWPSAAAGSRAADCRDPIVGRALQSIHRDPAQAWTVVKLAREVGTSRSVLGERFGIVIGQSPIAYLTTLRMQLAAERLRKTDDSIASIAAGVGYRSEAAFNRAFKRFSGFAPGHWRAAEA